MVQNIWLGLRSIAMTILLPGTVAVFLPYQLLSPIEIPELEAWTAADYLSLLMGISGLTILFWSIWVFAHRGRGTLAPIDEPRILVIDGLYRYVRNPMYVGVMLILIAECLFFWSATLLIYAGVFFVVVNGFIMGYEEIHLRAKFGDQYVQYCEKVGRWIPSKPYPGFVDVPLKSGRHGENQS